MVNVVVRPDYGGDGERRYVWVGGLIEECWYVLGHGDVELRSFRM